MPALFNGGFIDGHYRSLGWVSIRMSYQTVSSVLAIHSISPIMSMLWVDLPPLELLRNKPCRDIFGGASWLPLYLPFTVESVAWQRSARMFPVLFLVTVDALLCGICEESGRGTLPCGIVAPHLRHPFQTDGCYSSFRVATYRCLATWQAGRRRS